MIWCQVPPFMFVSFEKLVPLPGPVLKLVPPTYRHAQLTICKMHVHGKGIV